MHLSSLSAEWEAGKDPGGVSGSRCKGREGEAVIEKGVERRDIRRKHRPHLCLAFNASGDSWRVVYPSLLRTLPGCTSFSSLDQCLHGLVPPAPGSCFTSMVCVSNNMLRCYSQESLGSCPFRLALLGLAQVEKSSMLYGPSCGFPGCDLEMLRKNRFQLPKLAGIRGLL